MAHIEEDQRKIRWENLARSTENIYSIPFVDRIKTHNCDYCGYDMSGETRCPNCGQGVRTRNGKRYER